MANDVPSDSNQQPRASVRREPIAEGIRRLEREVQSFERRYRRDSESALQAVRAGQMNETAEVAKWLSAYLVLGHIRNMEGSMKEMGFREPPC